MDPVEGALHGTLQALDDVIGSVTEQRLVGIQDLLDPGKSAPDIPTGASSKNIIETERIDTNLGIERSIHVHDP